MRQEWVPLSASALVVGVMALVFGSLLNPLSGNATEAETLRAATTEGGRWLGMSVMFFVASVAMTLGLPSLLSLFTTKGRRTGLLGVGVFVVGVIGVSGYAMLLVFFRALAKDQAIDDQQLEAVGSDPGLSAFLFGWIGAFYVGLVIIAIALFLAKRTAIWVPIVIVVYVALFPFSSQLGRVGQVIQLMGLAAAFTAVAIAAVAQGHDRATVDAPA